MSKEAEMKDAEQTNEEKKDCANKELSKAELEKLTLEGMSVVLRGVLDSVKFWTNLLNVPQWTKVTWPKYNFVMRDLFYFSQVLTQWSRCSVVGSPIVHSPLIDCANKWGKQYVIWTLDYWCFFTWSDTADVWKTKQRKMSVVKVHRVTVNKYFIVYYCRRRGQVPYFALLGR